MDGYANQWPSRFDNYKKNHLHGRGGFGRGFGHGGLRLVLLKLIEDWPCHGYELIKSIEQNLGGRYSPSPGIVYPNLSGLEAAALIASEKDEQGRKLYNITDKGRDYLKDNAEKVNGLMAQMSNIEGAMDNAFIGRALANFKLSIRARLNRQPMAKGDIEALIDLIDEAAKKIERL